MSTFLHQHAGAACLSSGLLEVSSDAYPASGVVYRFSCGGAGPYTDTLGRVWAAGPSGAGGNYNYNANGQTPNPPGVANTLDDALYWKVMLGNTTFTLAVPDGVYRATGHFMEGFNTAAAQRYCALSTAAGAILIPQFDLWLTAGGRNVALQREATANAVASGGAGLALRLFNTTGQAATMSAIEVRRIG